MKTVVIISVCIMLLAAVHTGFCQSPKASLKDLSWLKGTWYRSNSKPGRSGSESWREDSPTMLSGTGVTMSGADTLFLERIQLIESDSGIYYIADVPHNKHPIAFKMTSVEKQKVTFRNPAHDFPKVITYALAEHKLHVVVSDDKKSVDYHFVRRP